MAPASAPGAGPSSGPPADSRLRAIRAGCPAWPLPHDFPRPLPRGCGGFPACGLRRAPPACAQLLLDEPVHDPARRAGRGPECRPPDPLFLVDAEPSLHPLHRERPDQHIAPQFLSALPPAYPALCTACLGRLHGGRPCRHRLGQAQLFEQSPLWLQPRVRGVSAPGGDPLRWFPVPPTSSFFAPEACDEHHPTLMLRVALRVPLRGPPPGRVARAPSPPGSCPAPPPRQRCGGAPAPPEPRAAQRGGGTRRLLPGAQARFGDRPHRALRRDGYRGGRSQGLRHCRCSLRQRHRQALRRGHHLVPPPLPFQLPP